MSDFGLDLFTIAGYLPFTRAIESDLDARVDALRLAAIGPVHGPPLPTHIASRRSLGGHPTGPYTRDPEWIRRRRDNRT